MEHWPLKLLSVPFSIHVWKTKWIYRVYCQPLPFSGLMNVAQSYISSVLFPHSPSFYDDSTSPLLTLPLWHCSLTLFWECLSQVTPRCMSWPVYNIVQSGFYTVYCKFMKRSMPDGKSVLFEPLTPTASTVCLRERWRTYCCTVWDYLSQEKRRIECQFSKCHIIKYFYAHVTKPSSNHMTGAKVMKSSDIIIEDQSLRRVQIKVGGGIN